MYLFCGDSHARQFRTDAPGVWSTIIASGATIKGLANPSSKSALSELIVHQAKAPRRKLLYIMLGGVDLDFSYVHTLCRDGAVDEEAFMASRIEAYSGFLQRLFEDRRVDRQLKGVRVLAPQPTPLRDEHFEAVTCQAAKVEPEALRAVRGDIDFSQGARNRRLVAFNDRLECELFQHQKLKVLRIDTKMLDEGGELLPQFYARKANDHHCNPAETLHVWAAKLEDDIPKLRRYTKRARDLARTGHMVGGDD